MEPPAIDTPQLVGEQLGGALVGAGKVVLGTDYPFDMGVTDPVERATATGLPAADLTAILGGNAASLLGLDLR